MVRSIFVLACWRPVDQVRHIREFSNLGFAATFICDTKSLDNVPGHGLQGVVYFKEFDGLLAKVESHHFSNHYVWLIIGDDVPQELNQTRYDADVTLLRNFGFGKSSSEYLTEELNIQYYLDDIYLHPGGSISTHAWAYWSNDTKLVVAEERERILRRLDFEGYPLRIAAPLGQYSPDWYNGSYLEYVVDETLTELDAGIRCGYAASALLIQLLNATEVVLPVELWATTINNSSMLLKLYYGTAELSGGILRVLPNRAKMLDYVMPIWPFSVGFTYLAERESSSNMFIEPFSPGVWYSCVVIGIILAVALRATSRTQAEKDDSFCAVLATFLQQDASAVPMGISGRWTFVVLSVCAMLVHAYYTSAIVSALMSAGSSGPESLRALADSKYAIASEDYDYMRYLYFDVETKWDDLEYLKRKKKTSKFYQLLERGVELIQAGNTAFHTEYNQIYPHFKTFTDDQICKLQHVDTIPEAMTWITTTKRGQYTNTFRVASTWVLEAGLGRRLVTRLLAQRPECRAQLLAERVKFGDVASLLAFTVFGACLSFFILAMEILVARKCRVSVNRDNLIVNLESE